ncbi:hypothetical protein VPH35_027669 [Triticum aestivum]
MCSPSSTPTPRAPPSVCSDLLTTVVLRGGETAPSSSTSQFSVSCSLLPQVAVAAELGGALGGMVRQLSVGQFENEGRRVIYGIPNNARAARKLLERQLSINSVPRKINQLARLWIIYPLSPIA